MVADLSPLFEPGLARISIGTKVTAPKLNDAMAKLTPTTTQPYGVSLLCAVCRWFIGGVQPW